MHDARREERSEGGKSNKKRAQGDGERERR